MRGGISPVTAKLLFEGPIKKDKSSYMVGVRSTYSNWILRQVDNPEVNKSNVYFNDINANINNEINDKNQVNLFGYFSIDNYQLATNISYNYYNLGSSLNWKHIYGKRLFSNTTAVYSNYHLEVNDEHQAEYAYQFKHNVKYHEISQFYTYLPSIKHEIKFGFNAILHVIDPGTYSPINSESVYKNKIFETERALESGLFIGDRFDVSQKLSIEGGLRFNMYNYLGPKTIYSYAENEPLSEHSVIDTTWYSKNNLIKTYSGIDIRFSLRYMINDKNSIKMGYSRINQYLFILTNTVSISPTDRWKLCDPFAKPILGDQYNFGYYRNFNKTDFEASVELYYKENKNTKPTNW